MTETELKAIKITADPKSAALCLFTVDRPVYDGSFYFPDATRAKGSALAERLFQIPGVSSVLIAHNRVTVGKADPSDWVPTARQIGAAIRAQFGTDQPAVDPGLRNTLPSEEELRERVWQVLQTRINPVLAGHGGFVQLIDVTGNTVYLQMGGGCQGCGMADVTLKQGVEVEIRAAVPEVGEILDTTDHAAGRNPYYTPSKK
jgi:Fe-S cluster biogenesis protein NfuA